ncbi:MAG: hypothetical protein ACYDCK_00550 [Thermoplasmatota archaeon]
MDVLHAARSGQIPDALDIDRFAMLADKDLLWESDDITATVCQRFRVGPKRARSFISDFLGRGYGERQFPSQRVLVYSARRQARLGWAEFDAAQANWLKSEVSSPRSDSFAGTRRTLEMVFGTMSTKRAQRIFRLLEQHGIVERRDRGRWIEVKDERGWSRFLGPYESWSIKRVPQKLGSTPASASGQEIATRFASLAVLPPR